MTALNPVEGPHAQLLTLPAIRPARMWVPFLGTLAAAAFVISLRIVLDPWLGVRVGYSFALPAILVITLLWGWRYGSLCAALAYTVAAYRIALPQYSFRIEEAGEWIALGVTLITTALVVGIAHAVRTKRIEVEDANNELRRVYHDLWFAEEEYRRAFDEDVVGRATVDPADQRILRANRTLALLTGRRSADLAGTPLSELFCSDDRDALATGLMTPGRDVECRLSPNDTEKWVSVTLSPISSPRGGPDRAILSVRDVTQRRLAERAAMQNEARFKALFGHAAMGVAECDPHGRFIIGNRRFCEILGRDESELRALSLAQITDPADIPRNPALREPLRAGASHALEQRLIRPDGSRVWVIMSIAPVLDERGEPARLIAVVQDVSERKRWEEDIATQSEQLAEIVRDRTNELLLAKRRQQIAERMSAVGTMASGVAHDVRSLLMPLRAHLESLEGSALSSRGREDVEAIRRVAEQFQRLTGGLRLLALDPTAAAGAGSVTDIKAWMAEIEPVLRLVAPSSVDLRIRIDEGLPTVHMGPAALTQAVINLVQNAGDALRGRPEARITVRAALDESGSVHVSVADTGPGMDDETLRRCTEPMFTTKANGTGLGLALVKELTEQVGGQLRIESREGLGATFTLVLNPKTEPVPPQDFSAVVDIADPRLAAWAEALLSAMRVTVVTGENAAEARLLITDLASADHLGDWGRGEIGGVNARAAIVLKDSAGGVAADRVFALGAAAPIPLVRRTMIDVVEILSGPPPAGSAA